MTWLPTSPSGPLPVAQWICGECPARCARRGIAHRGSDGEDLRADAVAHLTLTGHRVQFRRGTSEDIYPLAIQGAITV